MLIELCIHIVKVNSLDVDLVNILIYWVSRGYTHVASLLKAWVSFVSDAFLEARISTLAIETIINTKKSLVNSKFNINSSAIIIV